MSRSPYILLKFLLGIVPPVAFLGAYKCFLGGKKIALTEVPFSQFLKDAQSGRLSKVLMDAELFEVTLRQSQFGSTNNLSGLQEYITRLVPIVDTRVILDLLNKHGVTFGLRRPHWMRNALSGFLGLLPLVYVIFLVKFMSKMNKNPHEGDPVGKERKKNVLVKGDITFNDVQGIDAAKDELIEVVDFLKNPKRYESIGARLPKGILLSGPSGTGKTLLARAVASESGVPFISCSASDFVEMLVGRGASRVRELFRRGAKNSPCIIFIDELDALAKSRGGINSNDEREQTLNQLLTELDGFESNSTMSTASGGRNSITESIIVIAATNRPEVLDSALTRPGRFDRHVHVGLPDENGRKSIIRVHMSKIKIQEGVNITELANKSWGFSGAELANVVNEAALLAVRSNQEYVTMHNFNEALVRAKSYKALYSSEYKTMLEMD